MAASFIMVKLLSVAGLTVCIVFTLVLKHSIHPHSHLAHRDRLLIAPYKYFTYLHKKAFWNCCSCDVKVIMWDLFKSTMQQAYGCVQLIFSVFTVLQSTT